ncbi:hypothetical protein [Sphingomonas zeae]
MFWVALLFAADGQIAKFDDRKPEATYVSAKPMEDVERCLVRQLAPPNVYRQPDRPDDVMIVWLSGGPASGNAAARVDLHRTGNSTAIRSWLPKKFVEPCAPRPEG